MTARAVLLLRAASGALLVAGAAYLGAAKAGAVPMRPAALAGALGAVAVMVATLAALATAAALRERRLARCCEAVTAAGLLLAIGAGLANWALGIQGTVVLLERAPVRLASRDDLVALDRGPLADDRELDVTLGLARLRFEGAGSDGFRVVSRLQVLDARGEERALAVASDESAALGPLVLHQGFFGFAPRVVVARSGATLLDRHVPFRTVRDGPDGLSFVEEFEIASERLLLRGAVTLEDLNDDMKGHPRLELAVSRAGLPVGIGTLRPGEFVELEGGLRLGFAGLQRWSEIVFSRRNYRAPVALGLLVAALGGLAWAAATWRGR